MPRYAITHTTHYRHSVAVTAAWQSLHLQPRHETAQHCGEFALEISPQPADLATRTDYFGNKQHLFTLREPHTELIITSRSVVHRQEQLRPGLEQTPTLAESRRKIDRAVLTEEFTLEQFRHASPLVPLVPAARGLAAQAGDDTTPTLVWLKRLGAHFDETFTFDAKATTLSTPITEVLAHKRGVCQDFAHLFLSCLRQFGLPAAYVSGYLLTEPPPGQPRLRGADASHAWVSIHLPGTGWVDYDPTNACFVGTGHIVVARGRDYSDVSPVKGLFSGGSHRLSTGVTVEPAED